jgi:hypothetical protein
MLAAYNIRRSSVVLNPRGRVLGGLGEEGGGGDAGSGDGNDSGPGGGYDYGGSSYGDTAESQAAASAAAEAFAEAQMADEAAMVAASQALALTAGAPQKTGLQIALSIGSKIPGPVGFALGLLSMAVQYGGTPKTAGEIDQMFENARGGANGDAAVLKQIDIIKTNVTNAGSEAAVARLYQTYAKRNPDPASLAYWSNAFGPTITADEVLAFQEALYRNEPNLRPVAVTTQTATQQSSNLALPIIAAVAGFLIFGG